MIINREGFPKFYKYINHDRPMGPWTIRLPISSPRSWYDFNRNSIQHTIKSNEFIIGLGLRTMRYGPEKMVYIPLLHYLLSPISKRALGWSTLAKYLPTIAPNRLIPDGNKWIPQAFEEVDRNEIGNL